MTKPDWVACPHCGEEIDRKAKACRHCGSDEQTGWSQDTYLDGIDLPEEGEYEDGLEAEGFKKPALSRNRILLGVIAIVVALIFLVAQFR